MKSKSLWPFLLWLSFASLAIIWQPACPGPVKPDGSSNQDGSSKQDGGPLEKTPSDTDVKKGAYVHPNACEKQGNCPANPKFDLVPVMSLATQPGEQPEVVAMVPTTTDTAVVISSSAKIISIIKYSDTKFEFSARIPFNPDPDVEKQLTSVSVSPDGKYIALTDLRVKPGADGKCTKGFVHFVSISDKLGTLIKSVEVDYTPDSAAFSHDGKWLVVANEYDREQLTCLPADVTGGSVSIIDLSKGPFEAKLVKTLPITGVGAEPEGIKIADDNNTVIVTLQESSEFGMFKISDIEKADFKIQRFALPEKSEPDNVDVLGNIALISLEKTDSFSVVSLTDGKILSTYNIQAAKDVPATYNRDLRKSTKQHEPEGAALVKAGGVLFGFITLQESHGVVVYNLGDPTKPTFDSAAPVGLRWEEESKSQINKESRIGPEGIAVHPESAIVFTANEREGSVTMLKSKTFTIRNP